ncbi:MAG: hypothetical protein ABL909_09600, partial [Sphingopyxis sp.]
PSGRVQGPPDGIIPLPPANARPLPTPAAPPPLPTTQPLPSLPVPAGPVTNAPLPAPTVQRPVARPNPARPTRPVPVDTVSEAVPNPSTPLDAPLSSDGSQPALEPLAAPAGAETGAETGTDTLAQAPAVEVGDAPAAWPAWAPLVALGGAGACIFALSLWWPRRRRRLLALPAPLPEPEATPAPAPESVAAARTPPKSNKATAKADSPDSGRNIIGKRADLSMRFEALAAQSTLLNFRLRYAVTLVNAGPVDAANATLRIGLFAGTQASENGIAQWLMLPDQATHHMVETIAAGSEHRFEGELAAPLEALGPMTVEGRTLAIALMAIDARYHHPLGEAPLDGQIARAFVVGREPSSGGSGSGKLAPFRLDQGPTSFAPLGTRDTHISRNE